MKTRNPISKSPVREFIALGLVPNLGAYRIRLLMQTVDHPQEIFRLDSDTMMRIDGIGPTVAKSVQTFNRWDEVDRVLEHSQECGAELITYQDPGYPKLLLEIFDPPILLWVKGRTEVLDTPGVAVVGTRRVTGYGKEKAAAFSKALVRNGLTVVSGLALGVDGIAHKTAIEGGGTTVAVLGSGIDNIYPSNHKRLARQIEESGGAVISEFPPGTMPDAGNFPIRNRIVSGMTLGTLVIESGLKGGSMITARSALDQNREVFAIPHSLDNKNGEGCNALIKRGWGKLVQDVEDMLVELPITRTEGESSNSPARKPRWKDMELDEVSASICESLEAEALHIDELSERMNLPAQKLLPKLLELEMQECVRQTAGRNFELR